MPLGGKREEMHVTLTLTDDDLLIELRAACARWDTRDESEAGFARLYVFRDEALRRGLPVPMSCPREPPPGVPGSLGAESAETS